MQMKKKLVLGILFLLPVAFLLLMLSSKHYYNPLNTLKENIEELDGFYTKKGDQVSLKNHISVVMVFDEDPLLHIAEISNVNEKAYKWAKGFKGFQVIMLVPENFQSSEMEIRDKMGKYVDLEYWRFAYGTPQKINQYFNLLQGEEQSITFQKNTHFFLIDKELNLRGRLEDKTQQPLYGYDATSIAELQKTFTDDLRILFQEYRDKRAGKFDVDQRRIKELQGNEE